jgi:hypothetical protein
MSRRGASSGGARRRCRAVKELPERWVGATEFSEDPSFRDPVFLIRTVKQHPQILDPLVRVTTLETRLGTKRMEGSWALIMLAFVVSDHVDIEPFLKSHRSSPIWREAGFGRVPSVGTAWNRLTELERVAPEFVEAANRLIRTAIRHRPEIAQAVSVDGTGFETNARLEHCCPDPEKCRRAGGRPPKFQTRATNELIKETRHSEAEESEEAVMQNQLSSEPVEEADDVPSELENASPPRRTRNYRYFWLGSPGHRHLYRTLDPDAGARRYSTGRKKTWLGGLFQPAVSLFVDAPVAINLIPANASEHQAWPELEAKTEQALGRKPGAVIMDRAYSVRPVFEHNTRRGIATVSPWRVWRPGMTRADTDREGWDRHGVPRCRHCGGPGVFEESGLGFYFDQQRNPRIRFRCQLGMTSDCAGTQSIACEEEWRLLVPLSRRSERYHALSQAGKSLEHVFRHWRDRYQVAGNSPDTRPRRPGIAWQELRASAALLVEWLYLSLRHGWLGSHRHRNTNPVRTLSGRRRLANVLGARRRHGLDLPYGPAAVAAGLALPTGGGGPGP